MIYRTCTATVLLALALVTGCGEDQRPAASPAATELRVEVTGARPEPLVIALRCPSADCDEARLERLEASLRGARDDKRACTAIYGGPERAQVEGTLAGRPVDVEIRRSDGCGIADYDALFAALGRAAPLAG